MQCYTECLVRDTKLSVLKPGLPTLLTAEVQYITHTIRLRVEKTL